MSLKNIAVSASALAALALGTSALAPASAQDSGYYVQGNLGANFVVQDDASLTVDDTSFGGSYDADTGFSLGGALGKNFANGLRSELELTYRSNDIDSFEAEGIDFEGDGELTSTALLLNGYYDFSLQNTAFIPYVGAGIGYANVDAEDDNEGVFAWQLKAGLARPVTASGGLIGAEAVYFATDDVEYDIDGDSAKIEYGNTGLNVFFRQPL